MSAFPCRLCDANDRKIGQGVSALHGLDVPSGEMGWVNAVFPNGWVAPVPTVLVGGKPIGGEMVDSGEACPLGHRFYFVAKEPDNVRAQ